MAESEREINDSNYYFNLAVEQYSEINLYFYVDKCLYSNLRALCVGVKKGHVITRAPLDQIEHNSIVWGSEISGYFTVRDIEIEHCHFTSRLIRLYNSPPSSMFLVFPLPRAVDHQQRRFSKRVAIDEDNSDKFEVWLGEMDAGDSSTLPRLRWTALKHRQCEIDEISANGMRLAMFAKNPMAAKVGVNELVLLKGDFGYPGKPANLYVLSRVVRKMPDPEDNEIVQAGCHFFSWRKVDDSRNSNWFRADSQEGIGLVAQWVSRNFRNLQS